MASQREPGKKAAIAVVSIIAWLALLVAVLATTIAFSLSNLNHAGESASNIVQKLSQNHSALNSIVDQLKKDADPKTAIEIEQNRAAIKSAMASLGASKEFRDELAKTINEISQAILSGSKSVRVDFRQLAATVSAEINTAAKTSVISSQDLAKIKPQTLDLGKASGSLNDVRDRILWVLLTWGVWLLLMGSLFMLKGPKATWTAGIQLFSIGMAILFIRYVAPILANRAASHSDLPTYQRDLIPLVFNAFASSLVEIAAVIAALGFISMVVGQRITPTANRQLEQTVTD